MEAPPDTPACPFCGATDILIDEERHLLAGTNELALVAWHATCDDCAAHGPIADSAAEALALWCARPDAR